MEVTPSPVTAKLKGFFLKDPVPFAAKREVNWKAVKITGVLVTMLGIVVLLLLPTPSPEQSTYHEKAESGSIRTVSTDSNPSETTLSQFEQARLGMGTVPRNPDFIYGPPANGGSSRSGGDRNSSMIVARSGVDLKTQIPPGSRLRLKLLDSAIVSDASMPVIGVVISDYVHDDRLAIPAGTKIFGEVSFDDGNERAQFFWKSLQTPDGRERSFSAVSIDQDGQTGVQGKIHSEALKNTAGQTLTRFIGAYAEGSMQRGALGGNPGGDDNGWKNAIAETAKDRAETWAEGMKKEKKWIELRAGTEFFAVLKEPFTFRDPGGAY